MTPNHTIEKLEEVKARLYSMLEHHLFGNQPVEWPLQIENLIEDIDEMINEEAQKN